MQRKNSTENLFELLGRDPIKAANKAAKMSDKLDVLDAKLANDPTYTYEAYHADIDKLAEQLGPEWRMLEKDIINIIGTMMPGYAQAAGLKDPIIETNEKTDPQKPKIGKNQRKKEQRRREASMTPGDTTNDHALESPSPQNTNPSTQGMFAKSAKDKMPSKEPQNTEKSSPGLTRRSEET